MPFRVFILSVCMNEVYTPPPVQYAFLICLLPLVLWKKRKVEFFSVLIIVLMLSARNEDNPLRLERTSLVFLWDFLSFTATMKVSK